MLGMLGAAMAGGGKAIQDNATGKLKEKREKALMDLKNRYATKLTKQEAEYEAQAAQREHLIEERRRKEDHQNDIELQKLRNQGYRNSGGGGGGDSGPSRTDITALISQLEDEKEAARERLSRQNPGMMPEDIESALTPYNERIQRLRHQMPGAEMVYGNQGQGNSGGGDSGTDWSKWLD